LTDHIQLEERFIVVDGQSISGGDFLRRIMPTAVLSKLLGDYAELILDIFSWDPTTEAERFDMSRCSAAVQRLCMIKTSISSNILHKVAMIDKFIVGFSQGLGFYSTQYLDCKSLRQMAKNELIRRGKSHYDPSVYLSTDASRL